MAKNIASSSAPASGVVLSAADIAAIAQVVMASLQQAAPAAAAPVANGFVTLTRAEIAQLSPSDRVSYMKQASRAFYGQSQSTGFGISGWVGGKLGTTAANLVTAGHIAKDNYACRRMEYDQL